MIGVSVLGSLQTQQMSLGLIELSKKLDSFPADQLKLLVNPQILLDSGTRESLSPDMLVGLRIVFIEALDHVFFGGMVFVFIGLIASFFMGNARLVERNTAVRSAERTNNIF